jgi:hypothetical protein
MFYLNIFTAAASAAWGSIGPSATPEGVKPMQGSYQHLVKRFLLNNLLKFHIQISIGPSALPTKKPAIFCRSVKIIAVFGADFVDGSPGFG